MKLRYTSWVLLAVVGCWPLAALAQLQLVPDAQPQRVFAGDARKVTVVCHNARNKTVEADIHARLLQTSSATAVQLREQPWKKLSVLPSQTVIESARLDFPMVKTETKFLIQWLNNSNMIIGKTEVLASPTNLLAELKPLAGGPPLGVFDPENQLKPLLKNLGIAFADLENSGLENFSGKLAILGPFQSKSQMREELPNQIQALAKNSTAVVWLQPPLEQHAKPVPSFYSVTEGQIAVVIVQPELVSNLAEDPRSQLNLVAFCRLALHPQPPALFGLSPQP